PCPLRLRKRYDVPCGSHAPCAHSTMEVTGITVLALKERRGVSAAHEDNPPLEPSGLRTDRPEGGQANRRPRETIYLRRPFVDRIATSRESRYLRVSASSRR